MFGTGVRDHESTSLIVILFSFSDFLVRGNGRIFCSKDNLLLVNQVKYMHQEAWTGGKEYIVSALFKYLDLDSNGLLTVEELNKV